jgi:hypothetical protein
MEEAIVNIVCLVNSFYYHGTHLEYARKRVVRSS